MAQPANTKKVRGGNADKYQLIRDTLRSCIRTLQGNQPFSLMVKDEKDLENMFMALMCKESSLNPHSVGPDTLPKDGKVTSATRFLSHPAIKTVRDTGSSAQKAYVYQGTYAWGLTQSMGYNHVRGVSPSVSASTVCEIDRICTMIKLDASIQNSLTILPGDSIQKVMGIPGVTSGAVPYIRNQIISGLLILYSKWRVAAFDPKVKQWYVSVGNVRYYNPNRLLVAIGGYLGFSGRDAVGSNAASYVAEIVGPKYKEANGFSSNIQVASFEVTNSEGTRLTLSETSKKTIGCTASA